MISYAKVEYSGGCEIINDYSVRHGIFSNIKKTRNILLRLFPVGSKIKILSFGLSADNNVSNVTSITKSGLLLRVRPTGENLLTTGRFFVGYTITNRRIKRRRRND